jgi:hypothetical protein
VVDRRVLVTWLVEKIEGGRFVLDLFRGLGGTLNLVGLLLLDALLHRKLHVVVRFIGGLVRLRRLRGGGRRLFGRGRRLVRARVGRVHRRLRVARSRAVRGFRLRRSIVGEGLLVLNGGLRLFLGRARGGRCLIEGLAKLLLQLFEVGLLIVVALGIVARFVGFLLVLLKTRSEQIVAANRAPVAGVVGHLDGDGRGTGRSVVGGVVDLIGVVRRCFGGVGGSVVGLLLHGWLRRGGGGRGGGLGRVRRFRLRGGLRRVVFRGRGLFVLLFFLRLLAARLLFLLLLAGPSLLPGGPPPLYGGFDLSDGLDDAVDRPLDVVVDHQQQHHGHHEHQEDEGAGRAEDALHPAGHTHAHRAGPAHEVGLERMGKPADQAGHHEGGKEDEAGRVEEGTQVPVPKNGVAPHHEGEAVEENAVPEEARDQCAGHLGAKQAQRVLDRGVLTGIEEGVHQWSRLRNRIVPWLVGYEGQCQEEGQHHQDETQDLHFPACGHHRC